MNPLKIATVEDRDGKEVGELTATIGSTGDDTRIFITVEGPHGQRITKLLNKSHLLVAPVIPMEVWVELTNNPPADRPVRLQPLLEAMSGGQLNLEYDNAALETLYREEIELMIKRADAGLVEFVSSSELFKGLPINSKPSTSAIELLIEEFSSTPEQQDWLARFEQAFNLQR